MKNYILSKSAHQRSSIGQHSLLVVGLGVAILATGNARTQPFSLSLSRGAGWEVSFKTQTDHEYRLEAASSLSRLDWKTVAEHLTGTGALIKVNDAQDANPQRFYRVVQVPLPRGTISSNAVLPIPSTVYPEKTIIGSSVLGFQYTIPEKWKGILRENTSTIFFGSDTEAGLVLSFLTLAGDAPLIAKTLGQDFYVGRFGGFQVSKAAQVSGNKISIEWAGVGFDDEGNTLNGVFLQVQAVVHPSGGIIGYAGFFTQPNRALMERVVNAFVSSTVTVARKTRADLVSAIAGKSFVWVKSTSVGSGGTSGSLSGWKQNNAFFCPGTYEITTYSESSYSGSLSGGAFYTGGSSSNSTEAGDWTIIDTDSGPILVMISSEGAKAAVIRIEGNSIFFGDQQFDYNGAHRCN